MDSMYDEIPTKYMILVCYTALNFLFNHLRAIWPKGYQRRSLGNSHQNGDYVIQRLQVRILWEDNFFACFK